MPHRTSPAGPGSMARAARARTADGRRRLLAAGAFLLALGLAAGAPASVPRGDPAARLPEGVLAGESWDLVARFESGHVLMASLLLTNTGLGGRTAIAAGQIVEPDGTVHVFSRSERAGGWRLEDGGRRIDLRSIVLDPGADPRRFVVDKNEIGIEVAIEGRGAPAWPDTDVAPGCGLDVLEVAGPATGSFRAPGAERAVALHGLAALTHRWAPGLEVDCLRRGVELFAMQDRLGLYFRESETPTGGRHAWLLVQREGRTLFAGAPAASEIVWRAGATPGYPEPARISFAAPAIAGRVAFGAPLGSFEPLARLPAPLRAAMELRTRPRLAWSAPRVELEIGGRVLRAGGLAKLAWTNPLPEAPAEAAAPGLGGN